MKGNPIIRSITCLLATCLLASLAFGQVDFQGWQGLRVIEQQGQPVVMRAADLDADQRDELVVVNPRQSRLDIYKYLPADQREEAEPADPDRPNDLPMAPEFSRTELPLEQVPVDLLIFDPDGDGRVRMIVLVKSPNKVLVLEHDDQQQWKTSRSYDLLPASIAPENQALILRRLADSGYQLLISCSTGIQTLPLTDAGRADWLSPREKQGRVEWWLADLNQDGHDDLIETTSDNNQSVRWYQAQGDTLLPAEPLFDRAIRGAAVFRAPGPTTQLLLLDGQTSGLVRRYRLGLGEPSPLGHRRVLTLPGGGNMIGTGMMLDGQPRLVLADSEQPRVLTYRLGDAGWTDERVYPMVSQIVSLATSPGAEPLLLIQRKDAGQLHVSQWQDGRLTYPRPWSPPGQEDQAENESDDAEILTLQQVGATVWWARRVDQDVELYIWRADAAQPRRVVFKAPGKKVSQVAWLGKDQILFREQYARTAKLAVIDEQGDTKVSEPAHLKQMSFDQLHLYEIDGELRPARFEEGVVQWLGDDFHPTDQIMLPQGQAIASYVPIDANHGWAMERGGVYAHQLEMDDSGIASVVATQRLEGGSDLIRDPVLGLLLLGAGRVTHVSPGQTPELTLIDTIDERLGRPSGLKDAGVHRLLCDDLLGLGRDQVVLFDDQRHQLTVLSPEGDQLEPVISWPVFEDKKYPYAGNGRFGENVSPEPRMIVPLDFDADGHRDLALLVHDRLLIYLGRETP